MDIIFISELCIETLIGVYEWEKRAPQTIRLDLEVGLPETSAARRDELRDTIDYAQIVGRIDRQAGAAAGRKKAGRRHRARHEALTGRPRRGDQ